jgi:tRNA threonylcarbamoyladenosine biosynthesis protein TsaE
LSRELPDEAATQALGRSLAPELAPGMVVWLEGELGAGKTTLVRALLQALGYSGPVKSPTYTLVELYVVSRIYLHHFDFYRFTNPQEFLDAGLDEYFRDDAVCLVEWPDRAAGFVPPADLVVRLRFPDPVSSAGRIADLLAYSERGCECLSVLAASRGAA